MFPTLTGARRPPVKVAIAATAILALALLSSSIRWGAYRPRASDDRPPQDPRYDAALRLGLEGDLAGAESAFAQLARDRRGSSGGAWSLYQATLAAEARRDDGGAEEYRKALLTGYPGHPVVLRLVEAPSAAPPPRPKSDCGPRALQVLCQAAGHSVGLVELSRICGTDAHGTTLEGLARAARAKGLRVAPVQVDQWYLRRHRPTGLAWVDGDHYVAFFPGPTPDRFWLADPNLPERLQVDVEKLRERCQGIVLLAAWGERSLPPGLKAATVSPDQAGTAEGKVGRKGDSG